MEIAGAAPAAIDTSKKHANKTLVMTPSHDRCRMRAGEAGIPGDSVPERILLRQHQIVDQKTSFNPANCETEKITRLGKHTQQGLTPRPSQGAPENTN